MSSEDREQRNQVFSQAAQVDPRIPQVSAAERVKSDFGLDIPLELVPLPSCGRTYPPSSPLSGRETVEIRAMTAREEDILTSRAILKKGTVITELIRSCLTDKSINPTDMLTGDRNALMVAIRITGYGIDYDVQVECKECGATTQRTFNLGQLPIKRLEISPVKEGMNLFEYVLPVCKKAVRFKFLTGRDEEEIAATSDKQKKLGLQGESNVTTSLLYSIQSIEGVEEKAKIANFVKMMPARDSLSLRNYIKDNEPGIIMKQAVDCPSCGYSEEMVMPIRAEFLWPGS